MRRAIALVSKEVCEGQLVDGPEKLIGERVEA